MLLELLYFARWRYYSNTCTSNANIFLGSVEILRVVLSRRDIFIPAVMGIEVLDGAIRERERLASTGVPDRYIGLGRSA